MDLALDDEQEMLVRALRGALAGVDAEAVRAAWGTGHQADAWSHLAAMGLLEVVATARHVDDHHLVELALVARELGRVAAVTPLGPSVALAATAVGPEVLPGVVDGTVWGLAAHERGQRDAFAPAATRLAGDRVTGEKRLVEHAAAAAGFVVTCTAEDGPALAVVDADTAGVTVTPETALGGTPVGRVRLDGAVARHVVRGAAAAAALEGAWASGLLAQAAHLAGAAERLVEMTRDHVLARHQFATPLGTFQAVQHHLANMRAAVDGAELLVLNTAWVGPGPDALGLAAETKAWVAEAAGEVARRAHEIHGGIGVVDDHEVSLLSRRIAAEATLHGSPRQLWSLAGTALRGRVVGIPA